MFNTINSFPFETVCLFLLFVIIGSIFSIIEMRKKRPGNPTIWIFPFAILMGISLLIDKCAIALTTNAIFQKVSSCITSVCVVMFFLSVIVTVTLAYNKGYINKEKSKNLIPIFIIGLVFIIFGAIMLTIDM